MTTSDRDGRVGRNLVELIFRSPDWIHRRVERIEILPTGDCVHHHSLDITVPARSAVAGSKGRVLVPLGFLQKGPLSRFDASGPGGPVPLLQTDSNADLAVQFLRTLAERTYGREQSQREEVEELLRQIVMRSADDTGLVDKLGSTLESGEQAPQEDRVNRTAFLSVASQLSANFLMVVELDESVVDQRSILKYSYLEERNDPHGNPRYELTWSLHDFGSASSFHFELEAPPLLGITRMTLVETNINVVHLRPDTRSAASEGTLSNIAHRADRPSGRLASATVSAELRPKHYGVVSISFWATVAVAVALTVIVVVRLVRTVVFGPVPVGSTAGSLLLATGGILLTWISRTPEDWMVAKVLRNPRWHLVSSAGLLLAAACLMALPVAEPWRTWVWGAIAIAAWIVWSRAWRYRRLSRVRPPSEQHGWAVIRFFQDLLS